MNPRSDGGRGSLLKAVAPGAELGRARKGPGGFRHDVAEAEFVQAIQGLAELAAELLQVGFLRSNLGDDDRSTGCPPERSKSAPLDRA